MQKESTMRAKILFFILSLFSLRDSYSQQPWAFDKYSPSLDEQRLDSIHSYLDPKYSYLTPTNDSGFTVLGEWRWGSCIAAAAVGNYVYIGNGGLLQVLDVSQPATPRVVWEMKTPLVRDIKIRDTLACVLLSDGRIIFLNTSIPSTPTLLSEILLPFANMPISASVADSFVYVATQIGIVFVIDISNPQDPYRRGYIIGGGAFLSRIASRSNFIYYFSAYQAPALIIDARNPDSLISRYFPPGIGLSGISLHVSDTLLFAGVGIQLRVYSVAKPDTPVQLGAANIGTSTHSTTRRENYVYVSTFGSGLYVVDISSLTQPIVVNHIKRRIPTIGGGHSITISNGLLFSSLTIGLWTLDISQRDSLRPVSFFPTGGGVRGIANRDNLTFLADGEAGLWILDVTDLDSIRNISNLNVGGSASKIVVSGNYAYLLVEHGASPADITAQGLWILDVANPGSPFVTSYIRSIVHYSANLVPSSISKNGNHVYLTKADAVNDSALAVINISDPYSPYTESVFRTNTLPYDVVAVDTLAYLATVNGGLRILSVSQPSVPREIGTILSTSLGLAVRNHYVYVATDTGLSIVDVSLPSSPSLVGSTRTSGSRWLVDVTATNAFAYLGYDGLHAVDIRDPASPRESMVVSFPNRINDVVAVTDSLLFLGSSGLVIGRSDLVTSVRQGTSPAKPELFKLLQNYPNPFNPMTVIKYEIPRRTRVSLKVYDVLGRKVATLVDGAEEAGLHIETFDATSLSSGVYFYRLEMAQTTLTKKMIVQK